MLLRRVTEHVKMQNWTAVGLDFAIVVIGVFVGLQVSNLNETRQLKIDERATLIRLQAEAEEIVAFWQGEVFYSNQSNINRRLLLEVLARGTINGDEREAVDDAFLRLAHFPTNRPPRSVYNELLASGGLQRISDAVAREALSDYATTLNFIDGQLIQFRISLPGLFRSYQGHVFSAYDPTEASLRRFEYDIAALSTDRQFMSDMVDAVRDQLQFHSYRRMNLDAAIRMCEEISRTVLKTCEVDVIDIEAIIRNDGVNQ